MDKEQDAIALLESEVTNWELGEVDVTDQQGFKMRNVVLNARKNYFGIFSEPKDPTTGRQKIFIPLTETLVENAVKNIDIDTADIRVKAKNPNSHGVASVFRYVLKYYFDKLGFGKLINNVIRLVAIDGTAFVKTWRDGDELKTRVVDRLNMICDPSANDLTQTPIIERNLLTLPEFKKEAKDWKNTDDVEGENLIDRSGINYQTGKIKTEVPVVAVYERYGWFPKSILTGKEEDTDFFYGLIVCSGIQESNPVFHLAKRIDSHPYTLFKFKDIWNRLDGRGIGEMVINLNAYVNEIVNTRVNKHRITHLGMWKVRGGVTPQQLKKLFTTHAIKLKSQRDDIELMQTTDADQSTYQDEQVGKQWAQDVSGTFDEKQITASTPATNALIQERGTASRSNLVQENLGFALEELIEEHFIPIIKKILKPGDIIRITGNPSDLERMQEKLIFNEVASSANDFMAAGEMILPGQIEAEIARLTEMHNEQGEDRFVTINAGAFDTEFNIDVQIGEEELNPALIAQSITQALGIAAQFPGSRLDGDRLIQAQQTLGEPQAELAERTEQAKAQNVSRNEAGATPKPNSQPV